MQFLYEIFGINMEKSNRFANHGDPRRNFKGFSPINHTCTDSMLWIKLEISDENAICLLVFNPNFACEK